MTGQGNTQRIVRDWLHDELDAVGTPDRAIQAAVASLGSVPQRHPRRGVLRWLHRAPRQLDSAGQPELEVITWPSPAPPGDQAALRRAAGPSPVAAMAAVALLCLVGLTALVGLTVSGHRLLQGTPLSGSDSTEPIRPALLLAPADGSARDIVVDGTGKGHFWTVSEALEAAVDGDVIHIQPGVYSESLVVTKDVTLKGEGEPGAVVLAPAPDLISGSSDLASIFPGLRYIPDGFAMLGVWTVEPGFDTALLDRGWRYVLLLDHSDASIQDLSIRGSEIGTAVVISGGAPTLSRLVIDPDGEQRNKSASAPQGAVAIGGGSTATLSDSTLAAFVSVGEASKPTITGNRFEGTCLLVGGTGSQPDIRGNHIEDSQCPRYSVWVLGGAAPAITSNTIVGDHLTDGVRVNGDGSAPDIQDNTIAGGDSGIWIGDGAGGLVQRNRVSGARTGIAIIDAHPTITVNDIVENGTGIAIEGASRPDLQANTVCGNEKDIEIRDGEFSAPSALVDCATWEAAG